VSLMQEVTCAERSWSFARSATRYHVTKALGRDSFSCRTPASVTCVFERSSLCTPAEAPPGKCEHAVKTGASGSHDHSPSAV